MTYSKTELKEVIKESLQEFYNDDKVYSINAVAKRLKMHHTTVKKKIAQGLIKTTSDGLVTEKSIKDYLNGQMEQ